jgi:O-antigen/teichoic acid export membrane protein
VRPAPLQFQRGGLLGLGRPLRRGESNGRAGGTLSVARTLSMLSLILAGVLGVLLLLAFAFGTAEGSLLDRVVPVVFWIWLVATPVLAVAGAVLSGRAELQSALRMSAPALLIWVVVLAGALLLH